MKQPQSEDFATEPFVVMKRKVGQHLILDLDQVSTNR
jgi:hypothetical protein